MGQICSFDPDSKVFKAISQGEGLILVLGFRVLLRGGAVGWQALRSVADLEVLAKACHDRFGGGGLGLTAAEDAEWAEPDHVLVTPQYALPNCNWGSLPLSFQCSPYQALFKP